MTCWVESRVVAVILLLYCSTICSGAPQGREPVGSAFSINPNQPFVVLPDIEEDIENVFLGGGPQSGAQKRNVAFTRAWLNFGDSGSHGVSLADANKQLSGQQNSNTVAGSRSNPGTNHFSINQNHGISLTEANERINAAPKSTGATRSNVATNHFSVNQGSHGVSLTEANERVNAQNPGRNHFKINQGPHGVSLTEANERVNAQNPGRNHFNVNQGPHGVSLQEANRNFRAQNPNIATNHFSINQGNHGISLSQANQNSRSNGFTSPESSLGSSRFNTNTGSFRIEYDSLEDRHNNHYSAEDFSLEDGSSFTMSLGRRYHPLGIPTRSNSFNYQPEIEFNDESYEITNPYVRAPHSVFVAKDTSIEGNYDDSFEDFFDLSPMIRAQDIDTSNERLTLSTDFMSQYNFVDTKGSTNWGYKTEDQYQAHQVHTDGTHVGKFGWTAPEGSQVHIKYIADERGYRVISQSGTYLRDTENVRREKEKHFQAHDDALNRLENERNKNRYNNQNSGSGHNNKHVGTDFSNNNFGVPLSGNNFGGNQLGNNINHGIQNNFGIPLPGQNNQGNHGFNNFEDDVSINLGPGGLNIGVPLPSQPGQNTGNQNFGIALPEQPGQNIGNQNFGIGLPEQPGQNAGNQNFGIALPEQPGQTSGNQNFGIPIPGQNFNQDTGVHIPNQNHNQGGQSFGIPIPEINLNQDGQDFVTTNPNNNQVGQNFGIPIPNNNLGGQDTGLSGNNFNQESFGVSLPGQNDFNQGFGISSVDQNNNQGQDFGVAIPDQNLHQGGEGIRTPGTESTPHEVNTGFGLSIPEGNFNQGGQNFGVPIPEQNFNQGEQNFGLPVPDHNINQQGQDFGVSGTDETPHQGFGLSIPQGNFNQGQNFGSAFPEQNINQEGQSFGIALSDQNFNQGQDLGLANPEQNSNQGTQDFGVSGTDETPHQGFGLSIPQGNFNQGQDFGSPFPEQNINQEGQSFGIALSEQNFNQGQDFGLANPEQNSNQGAQDFGLPIPQQNFNQKEQGFGLQNQNLGERDFGLPIPEQNFNQGGQDFGLQNQNQNINQGQQDFGLPIPGHNFNQGNHDFADQGFGLASQDERFGVPTPTSNPVLNTNTEQNLRDFGVTGSNRNEFNPTFSAPEQNKDFGIGLNQVDNEQSFITPTSEPDFTTFSNQRIHLDINNLGPEFDNNGGSTFPQDVHPAQINPFNPDELRNFVAQGNNANNGISDSGIGLPPINTGVIPSETSGNFGIGLSDVGQTFPQDQQFQTKLRVEDVIQNQGGSSSTFRDEQTLTSTGVQLDSAPKRGGFSLDSSFDQQNRFFANAPLAAARTAGVSLQDEPQQGNNNQNSKLEKETPLIEPTTVV